MNEWIKEGMNRTIEWMNKWTNEWMNERMNDWNNEWMREWGKWEQVGHSE